jgi:hypothetical protein
VAAYYVVSEALTNAAKHAEASRCATTGWAAPTPPGGPGWSVYATASRPRVGTSRWTARPVAGRPARDCRSRALFPPGLSESATTA